MIEGAKVEPLKYLDVESEDELPPFVPMERKPWSVFDTIGVTLVIAGVFTILVALVRGFVDEARFIGRIFR